MGEIDKVVAIPDEVLDSIVGGTLTERGRELFRTSTQKLKNSGLSYNNALAYWRQQTEGNRLSDEDWQEIEDIVNSVYGV